MSLKLLERAIEIYKPIKDINTIIIETNKIFHSYDAKNYDNEHPEIFEQLPQIYKEMCKLLPTDKKLKILDFGCGTGFEAVQLLNNLNNIEMLCCYDISDEMLNICKQKLNMRGSTTFIDSIDKMPPNSEFNVLITNSLLHHLPQPLETINNLKKFLSNDCFYIMGHEGSVRFYKNSDIIKANQKNSEKDSIIVKTLKRIANIKNYPYYAKKIMGIEKPDNAYKLTARKTVEYGLFEAEPNTDIINKIIDCYVPFDVSAANEGQGFDFKNIELHNEWKLLYSKTYNFLNNNIPYDKLSKENKRKYTMLEEKYPDDGLNFCCVWQKESV